ncbi:MAG TPA: carboxypeptidase regulatory-like domain-containing protein [Vicinamibacterales bacterium]|nr:carboxypeptidase regulatory-like domain-containing protein [Vicinamibacterales bacterium]
MRRKILPGFAAVLTVIWLISGTAATAFAQGGAGATTGSINGKVVDASGGVLPGVTVTAKSPSLMGVQVQVTDGGGNYRFPALPPGTYTVSYELTGFKTLERTNIQISIGFTATVNVELTVASLEEAITVTGDSPVIDTTSTRVQQNFKLEELQQLPNARDMWALIAVTPSVTMSRTDVGGSQAGNQASYRAYGFSGQRQVILEGINITYDASLSQLYPDYGSLEEVSVETISHGAEVAGPGVQTRMLTKSGGNDFHGETYLDYVNNSMQSANIPDEVIAQSIREHSNETEKNRNFATSFGGPIKTDRVWWHFSYHDQSISVAQPNFIGPIAGTPFGSTLRNFAAKGTVQLNQSNKVISYVSRNWKEQPYFPVSANFFYTDLGQTTNRYNDVWVYKGEWNSTISNKMFVEAVYGGSNLLSTNLANTDTTEFYVVDSGRAIYRNGERKRQYTPERDQFGGSLTYFEDRWGTHNLRIGGGIQPEMRNDGYTQQASGNVRENINNGAPVSVVLYAPTAKFTDRKHHNEHLTTQDRLNVASAYIADQWAFGRATMNLGVRYDRYRAYSPEQIQLPYSFGPLVVEEKTFAPVTYFTWNKIVPRLGLIYDLSGNGKTVVKLNYGLYAFDPGISLGGNANPNQLIKSVTYTWADNKACAGCIANDGIYQPGEEGNQTASSLANNIKIDQNLKQPTSKQTTVYLERQLTEGVGARVGFVYYTVKDQIAQFQPFRPASAYTVPFTIADRGADNVLGTADDANLTFYGIPNSQIANFPNTSVVMNTPNNGQYKTLEFSMNKRHSANYSLGASFGYTWMHDFPENYPNTPNGPFDYDYRVYSAKATGTYDLPYDIIVSGVYRFQAGPNYARTLSVAAPASCACTFSAARGDNLSNTTVYVTPYDAYTQDNVSVLDLRAEKTISLRKALKARVFADLFNAFNRYSAETISVASGSAFQRPTAILGPRTGRIGFRINW